MLIENGEIGHRVRTKRKAVLSVLDGQFHETWYSFREIPVLELSDIRVSVMTPLLTFPISNV